MFNLRPNKIYEVPKDNSYFRDSSENEYAIRKLILEKYGYAPSYLYLEDFFSINLLEYLFENGRLLQFNSNASLEDILKNPNNFRTGNFWFAYKDIFVKLTLKNDSYDSDTPLFTTGGTLIAAGEIFTTNPLKGNSKEKNSKTFTIMICAPSNIQKYPIEDFEKFTVVEENVPKVHLFIKNQYGDYVFEPISVNLPENLDLSLNYGKKFLDVDKKIKERLTEKSSGLYMFHGPPGTGKTTYIKHLAYTIGRDFIYIPTTMIEYFTTDPNCLHTLIQKPNSVIILEDAEKAILKRVGDGMDSSAVSSLLNLSDGILSDILKTSVIVTYNCAKQDIDDALKRKGRLQAEYEFGCLPVDDAIKLGKHLKYPKKLIEEKITEPMSISDIYNLEKEVEFYAQPRKKDPQRIIGFGNA